MLTVTAFEARDLMSVRIPSQIIAWFIAILYLFCALGEFLNVDWSDPALPAIDRKGNVNAEVGRVDGPYFRSRAIVIIASLGHGYRHIPGLLNACLIFSALSASNASLYVASRILFGMTRNLREHSSLARLKGLGVVWHRNAVPMRALGASAVAFFWLPFLSLNNGISISEVWYSICKRDSDC